MKNNIFIAVLFLFCSISFQIKAQTNSQRIICNPLNLNYRFQLENPSRREAADPVVLLFRGKYFMFASKSGGYWFSDDMINWQFITTSDLPLEDYAPAVVSIDDALYFLGLNKKIYKSTDPLNGKWEIVKENFTYSKGDPDLFLDDDGRLYLYHGISNFLPIYAIELDKKTFEPVGVQKELFKDNVKAFGWERNEDYNTGKKKPFLEGAWMNKHNGIYYLQYSAPGTQYKCYADGLYTASSPLGPFTVAPNNPFAYKPEGFITGAGHGSSFEDKYGNYWHFGTNTISLKEFCERRLGMFPAFFDKDGVFYTYTAYGDYPHVIPNKKLLSPDEYQPTGMLLSYNKPVEVSSSLKDHPKEFAVNEQIREFWSAETGNKGEWIMIDLENSCTVNSVQINYYDQDTSILGRPEGIYIQYLLEYSNDKKSWKTLVDKTKNKTDIPHDFISLNKAIKARYIRLTNYHVPDGKFAISGLRIFGKGVGKSAEKVTEFSAVRDQKDPRNVTLKWNKVDNATGYMIRYGTAPDKLYLNYQILNDDSLIIHSLNSTLNYYFSIDTFNEIGITKGEQIYKVENVSK